MLSKIKVKNYKPITEGFEIPFNRINILTGVNSCGKSSFIQTLLILKKTFSDDNPNEKLNLLGENFNDIINGHDTQKILSFKYSINLDKYKDYFQHDKYKNIIWNKLIVDVGIKSKAIIRKSIIINQSESSNIANKDDLKLYVNNFTITFVVNEDQEISLSINLKDKILYDIKLCGEKGLIDSLDLTQLNDFIKSIGKVNIEFNKFFPVSFKVSQEDNLKNIFMEHKNNKQLLEFMSIYSNIKIPEIFNYIPSKIFVDISKNIKYFNPLRSTPINMPFVVIPSSDEQQAEQIMEENGSNAFKIFCDEKDNKVEYFDYEGNYIKNKTLYSAVKYWMIDVMHLTKEIRAQKNEFQLHKKDKLYLYDVLFSSPYNKSILSDVNNVGFGISQVFPIIVEGLRAASGTILICEQPEIHLHPKVQTILAEFFISLARKGVILIIETHSDHLINSFTYNSVRDISNKIRDYLNIYYFEKEGNKLQAKKIYFDQIGNIDEWPKNFLSNEYSEHLLKMTKVINQINYQQED